MIDKTNILKIQELRMRTGIGILECKKALLRSKGDIEASIDYLRMLGYSRASIKMKNKTLQGSIFININKKIGVMLEINCETDFVEKNEEFISFGNKILNKVILYNIRDISSLRKKCEVDRMELISKVNENINIRRLLYIEDTKIISYLHRKKIGVLVIVDKYTKNNFTVVKEIAMHIASNKPEFLKIEDIPESVLNREYLIQLNIVKKMGKSKILTNKIVQGKINKFKNQIVLLEQPFVINPKKTIKKILKENNIVIKHFTRFEVGEII